MAHQTTQTFAPEPTLTSPLCLGLTLAVWQGRGLQGANEGPTAGNGPKGRGEIWYGKTPPGIYHP